MVSFLDPSNQCGQTLLKLVSRGNAIIAELFRLSEQIPPVFKSDQRSEFAEILCDFSYFKVQEAFEKKIESSEQLSELDKDFRENYIDIVTKFYLAFESIHKYVFDLNRFVEDVEEGNFIQESLETLFFDVDGKQLACESLFLLGVMMLIADDRFEGLVRERLLVSYFRYSAQRSTSDSNIDDVCNLLRSTGYTQGRRPANYPDDYLKRAKLNSQFISMVIGRLRSDDIYNQVVSYPFPEHRSASFASQSSMLFVCLYFNPDILHNQHSKMREIVDKFFPDNWVFSVYMGRIVNLIYMWDSYKAAKQALNNTIDQSNIKEQCVRYHHLLNKLLPQLQQLLKEGALSEETVIESTKKLINVIRESNVTLRWLLLHATANLYPSEVATNIGAVKRCRSIRDMIVNDCKLDETQTQILQLLMLTAQLELKVKEMVKTILTEKPNKLAFYKQEAYERLSELGMVFSGERPLTRIEKNVNLENWFKDMAKEIDSLEFDENNERASKKILRMIRHSEEVQEFHQLESNLQVKQFMVDTRHFMLLMLKVMSINEDVLVTLQVIGDLSYAWEQVDACFTKSMQAGIKKDPSLVIKLRATFLKLASALDLPLLRINQAQSPDLVAVSQFYSLELVSYIRKVLHIIPETLFNLMARVIELQTNSIKELPTRLIKDDMKTYSQLEERHEVAKLTHFIAVFTEGLLMMKTTLVGIIKIDAKRLLEDGIRKELVKQVSNAFHQELTFNSRAKPSQLNQKLAHLATKMDGFRRSFEYIQDYVCIYGLKIWQEEVSRIVNFNVEQECNSFLREKVHDWESIYQSKAIPIPKFPPIDNQSVNFIGRLAREILRVTSPKASIYVYQMGTWYDNKSKETLLDPKFFNILLKGVGTAGVNGLDKLFCFMIANELHVMLQTIDKTVTKDPAAQEIFQSVDQIFSEEEPSTPNFCKFLPTFIAKATKYSTFLVEPLLKIGQLQILRANIAHELSTICKFQSRHYADALTNFNEAALTTMAQKRITPKNDSQLAFELTNHMEYAGFHDPLEKIYSGESAPDFIHYLVWMSCILEVPKMAYYKSISSLTAKKPKDAIDGMPFIWGCCTAMRQFHEKYLLNFIDTLASYISYLVQSSQPSKGATKSEINQDAISLMVFLEDMMTFSKLNKSHLTGKIPDFLSDTFHSLAIG